MSAATKPVKVAATQMACGWDREANIAKAEALVRTAAGQGAKIVLLQELFETPYFCKDHDGQYFALAQPIEANPAVMRMRALARELGVVLPVSVFERSGNAYFNTLAMIDAGGELMGIYRKSHIPESVGYHEKYYFSPGDTGFKVWNTRYGKLGVGVCWDQWFPECARAMTLLGADLLLYPTAIGSEPADAEVDSRDHWQRVMQGHAGANVVPLIASNRIGVELGKNYSMTFYGSSFIADHTGAKLAEADRTTPGVITADLDLDRAREYRHWWGLFRDRRPDLYGALGTLDGKA